MTPAGACASLGPREGLPIPAGQDTARELELAIQAGVDEVRYRNGLILAWLRIALRVLTLALWIAALVWDSAAETRLLLVSVAVTLCHLAVAGWVLLELRARRRVELVLTLAAVVDVLVVAFAGWSRTPGAGAGPAGFLMGVMQLMLLFSALTLPHRRAAALGAACVAWQVVLGVHLRLTPAFTVELALMTAVFAVAVTWAGTRMVELAARHALGDFTAQLVRAHRDELAAANLQIAAQRDEVLAAQAEAETMARLVVHDLKNPLAALQQFVSLALTRLERAAGAGLEHPELVLAREDLALATTEGDRLTAMVGDLLLIARLERASLSPVCEATPIHALLVGVARGARLRAEDRAVAVAVTVPPDLLAPLDLDMIRRLLENLLANALRFVDRGGKLELAAAVEGGALVLAVRNTGPAVSAEARPYLFQKHGKGAARRHHNVGLGLYLCRLVAEAHGGSIALVERPGWGAAFEARLPLEGGPAQRPS
jgi:signal transduction histidine kinase